MGPNDATSAPAIGRRLYELRTKARLSQKTAGRIIGVSPPTYGKIERGRRPPTPTEIAMFTDYYHVDVRWISCGLSPRECEVVDVMRKPDIPPTPQLSSVVVFRKAG